MGSETYESEEGTEKDEMLIFSIVFPHSC